MRSNDFQIIIAYWKSINSDRFKVHNIINIAGKYFYVDEIKPSKYHVASEKFIMKLLQITIIILILILISYGLAALSGLYAIIFVDSHNTFLGTETPFVNSNNHIGHVINIILQLLISCLSLISNITIEIGVCIVYNAFALMPELIYLESQELDDELNMNGTSLKAMMTFRNIVAQTQDYNKLIFVDIFQINAMKCFASFFSYLQECLDVYYVRLFFGPLLLMYSISFSIFGQMIVSLNSISDVRINRHFY